MESGYEMKKISIEIQFCLHESIIYFYEHYE